MLDPTPHATPPASRAENEWVGFAIGEAGQVEVGNADKAGTRHILKTCQEKYDEAMVAAKKKLRPKFLGIF